MHASLIIGAGSGIGSALAGTCAARDMPVCVIGRAPGSCADLPGVQFLQSDHSEESMATCVRTLREEAFVPTRIGIFLGILHDHELQPEKRLEDIGREAMLQVIKVNSVLPLLWLQHLLPLIDAGQDCRVAVLSARVGSIADNRLGGWYAYRASKAALNMLLKTAAVELARRAPNVKLVAFHPGTTDTPLSRPFQSRVPEGKLFQPDFVAGRLLEVLESLAPDGTLSYVDYNGETIPW